MPIQVSGLSNIVEVAAGQHHSLALENDGVVHAWGANTNGQLGDGTTLSSLSDVSVSEADFLWRTATPRLSIGSGTYNTDLSVVIQFEAVNPGAAIHYTTSGVDPTVNDASIVPGGSVSVTAPLTLKARAFETGFAPSHIASATYTLQVGTPSSSPEPGTYHGPRSVTLSTVTSDAEIRYTTDGSNPTGTSPLYSGPLHLLATTTLKAKGFRTSWNDSGIATSTYTISPLSVAAGDFHSLVLASDGSLWSWGENQNGQLGDDTTTDRKVPGQVSGISNVIAIEAGDSHNLALKSDGSLWAWGYNWWGQLGDGTYTTRRLPVQISALSDVIAVAAGDLHSLALTSDGKVWAWGYNAKGQLGDGTTTYTNQPQEVSGLSDVVAIAAGKDHSLAVKADGTAWAWGENANGQIGDGTKTQRNTPVQIDGLSGIVVIAGGDMHSMALRDDGRVFSWGYAGYGQIGNGSTLEALTPVPTSIANVVAISAGGSHSLAIKDDGSVWGWGQQTYGQVGDGSTESTRLVPVELSGPTDTVAVSGGSQHSFAVTAAGGVWAWGRNNWYQIGDGTNETRLSPVRLSEDGFDWKAATPTFSIAAGNYTSEQNVVVTTATPNATIHYTTNGAEPTESDPVVASGSSVTVDQSMTLKAKVWEASLAPSNTQSAAYTLTALTPTFTPGGGTYSTAQNVTMATGTSSAEIRYTADGSEPTGSSTLYTGPVQVSTTTTLKAKAFRSGWTESDTRTATYTMSFGTLSAPTMDPDPGTFVSSAEVSLGGPLGATLRYTTDGSDPTASSPIYTAPLTFTLTTTLKAKAFHPDYTPSTTTTGVYTIKVPTPTFDPGGGSYLIQDPVTISVSETGATIHYTIDGTGTTTYGYHSVTSPPSLGAGRLESVDGPLANDVITYTYDELGRVKSRAIDGVSLTYTYDSLGRITSEANALGTFTYEYEGVTSRLRRVSYPNGQTSTRVEEHLPPHPAWGGTHHSSRPATGGLVVTRW